jgi:hypothetical protein
VTCTATDAAGNTAVASFTVTVLTRQPPVLQLPPAMSVDATAPGGASVVYQVTASDDGVVPPTVSCVPPSGGTFRIGSTTVTCTATDDTGLVTTGSFTVHVRGAGEQVSRLLREVTGISPRGAFRALLAAAGLAIQLPGVGCPVLSTAARLLQGPSAKQLPTDTAARWLAAVRQISAVVGCTSGTAGGPRK